MAVKKSILKVSQLPELKNAEWNGIKTITAYDKKNYLLDVKEIKGKKISSITESASSESGGANVIYINFDDSSREYFHVYNGHDGKKGKDGEVGDKGNQGESVGYSASDFSGVTNGLIIVNNNTTEDSDKGWSAYQAYIVNNTIYDMNEIFLTEEEYARLWASDTIVYMNAQFVSSEENEEATIFNADVNPHIVYKKYWTYEEGEEQVYYIYNETSGEYNGVVVNIWDDVYFGPSSGYFPASSEQVNDGTQLYYTDDRVDADGNPIYHEVTQVRSDYTDPDTGEVVKVYFGDKEFDYYSKELDAFVHVTYSGMDNTYNYELIVPNEIPVTVFEFDSDEQKYVEKSLNRNEFDLSGNTFYFEEVTKLDENNEEYIDYDVIKNIQAYIAQPDTRYYKASYDANGNKTDYIEVSSISEIDEENDDYIIYNYISDTYNDKHRFSRTYPEIIRREKVLTEKIVEFDNNGVDYYVYTENRKYYELVTSSETNPDTGEVVFNKDYIEIQKPYWIVCKFLTTEEDENTQLLTSLTELGPEDNTIEDDTSEEPVEEEKIKIDKIIVGEKETIYRKDNINDSYIEVDIKTEEVSNSTQYYLKTGVEKTAITGQEAKDKRIYILYTYNSEMDEYEIVRNINSISNQNTYFYDKDIFERIPNISQYLYHTDVTIFNGEPYLLPINIYPINTTDKEINIEYDSDIIQLYDDGKIASIYKEEFNGNNKTDIVLYSMDDVSCVAYIHLTLTTPVKRIEISSETELPLKNNVPYVVVKDIYPNEDEYKSSFILKYELTPETASNKEVDIEYNHDVFTCERVTDDEGNNLQAYKFTCIAGSEDVEVIRFTPNDKFIENVSTSFSVYAIHPITEIDFDRDVIKHVKEYYTEEEAYEANLSNIDEYGNVIDPSKIINEGDLKEEYDLLVLLLNKETILDIMTNSEATDKSIEWSYNNLRALQIRYGRELTFIDEESYTRNITQEDIDNGVEGTIGDEITIPAVTHTEVHDTITGLLVGTYELVGKTRFGSNLEIHTRVRVDQAVERIDILPQSLVMNIGTSKKLTATVYPEDALFADYRWESSNPNIVSISETGTVKALADGAVTIRAIALDGSDVVGTCQITSTIPISNINLYGTEDNSENGIIYVGIGSTTKVTLEVLYNENNRPSTELGVNWDISDKSIARIDESGNVTGLALGKATIIAYGKDNSGVFGTIQVEVIQLASSVSFENDEYVMDINDTLVLVPNFLPINTSKEIVVWESSDETIAKVKNSGIIYALSSGTATITITTTDGSKDANGEPLKATCTIIVN